MRYVPYTQKTMPRVKVLGQALKVRLILRWYNPHKKPMIPLLKFLGPSPKRPSTSEAILCMLGDMKTIFDDALKSTKQLQMPQVTSLSVIFATLEAIPDMSQTDKLRVYGKLILSERLYAISFP
jgi:hypothetical protein